MEMKSSIGYVDNCDFLNEQHVDNLFVLMHDIFGQDEQSYINPFLSAKSTELELRDEVFNYKIMAYAKFRDEVPIAVLCINMPDIRNRKTAAEVKFFNCEALESNEYIAFIKQAINELRENGELNKISISLACQNKNYVGMSKVLKEVGFVSEVIIKSALIGGSDVEILSLFN